METMSELLSKNCLNRTSSSMIFVALTEMPFCSNSIWTNSSEYFDGK